MIQNGKCCKIDIHISFESCESFPFFSKFDIIICANFLKYPSGNGFNVDFFTKHLSTINFLFLVYFLVYFLLFLVNILFYLSNI